VGAVDLLSAALLAAGCFFVLTGAVGVLRFPDFHSRMHPAAKGDTLGQVLILAGLVLHLGWQRAALELLLISLFLFLTAPTATHAMARSAWLAGVKPEEVPEEPEE
jgi:multicomponent Na+:H+ antiporter subunit G